jgi:CBS-domain-containing membrane protein
MMHKGVECVSPDTAINAIAKKMRELDFGAIPVATNGNLVGMVTDRDITIRCVADDATMSKIKAKDVMTSGVVYCRDNEDVEDAVRIMEGKQIRRLPVLNEAMQMVGMVSLGDVRTRCRAISPARWRRPSQRTIPNRPGSIKLRLARARASTGQARRARSYARGARRPPAPRARSRPCRTRPFAAPPAAPGCRRS